MTRDTLVKKLESQHRLWKILFGLQTFALVTGLVIARIQEASRSSGSQWGTQITLLFVVVCALEANSIGRSLEILGLITEPAPAPKHENPPEPPEPAGLSC